MSLGVTRLGQASCPRLAHAWHAGTALCTSTGRGLAFTGVTPGVLPSHWLLCCRSA